MPLSLRAAVTFRIDGGHQFRLIDVRKKIVSICKQRVRPAKNRVIICRSYERRFCPVLWRTWPTPCAWVIGSLSLANYVRVGRAYDFG